MSDLNEQKKISNPRECVIDNVSSITDLTKLREFLKDYRVVKTVKDSLGIISMTIKPKDPKLMKPFPDDSYNLVLDALTEKFKVE